MLRKINSTYINTSLITDIEPLITSLADTHGKFYVTYIDNSRRTIAFSLVEIVVRILGCSELDASHVLITKTKFDERVKVLNYVHQQIIDFLLRSSNAYLETRTLYIGSDFVKLLSE